MANELGPAVSKYTLRRGLILLALLGVLIAGGVGLLLNYQPEPEIDPSGFICWEDSGGRRCKLNRPDVTPFEWRDEGLFIVDELSSMSYAISLERTTEEQILSYSQLSSLYGYMLEKLRDAGCEDVVGETCYGFIFMSRNGYRDTMLVMHISAMLTLSTISEEQHLAAAGSIIQAGLGAEVPSKPDIRWNGLDDVSKGRRIG